MQQRRLRRGQANIFLSLNPEAVKRSRESSNNNYKKTISAGTTQPPRSRHEIRPASEVNRRDRFAGAYDEVFTKPPHCKKNDSAMKTIFCQIIGSVSIHIV